MFIFYYKYQALILSLLSVIMKRITYIILFIFFLLIPVFCKSKKSAESEFSFKTKLIFNVFGPNYQGYGPVIGKRLPMKKGDRVIIVVSGVSDKDLGRLYFSVVDRNSTVEYWRNITPKNQLYIEGIKANQVFTSVFEIELTETPFSMNQPEY